MTSVHNLLAAGTIVLRLASGWSVEASGNFELPSKSQDLANLLVPEESAFVKAIYFLLQNDFIATQCAVRRGTVRASLLMRIYVVPYDLPGMHGRLRLRDQKVLGPAGRHLRILLARVSRNSNDWEGSEHASGSMSEPVLPPETVCTTHSSLFANIH